MMWQPGNTLADVEKTVILAAMRFYRDNKTQTAQALGISINTLRSKLESYQNANGLFAEAGIPVQPPIEPPKEQSVPMREQEKVQGLPSAERSEVASRLRDRKVKP